MFGYLYAIRIDFQAVPDLWDYEGLWTQIPICLHQNGLVKNAFRSNWPVIEIGVILIRATCVQLNAPELQSIGFQSPFRVSSLLKEQSGFNRKQHHPDEPFRIPFVIRMSGRTILLAPLPLKHYFQLTIRPQLFGRQRNIILLQIHKYVIIPKFVAFSAVYQQIHCSQHTQYFSLEFPLFGGLNFASFLQVATSIIRVHDVPFHVPMEFYDLDPTYDPTKSPRISLHLDGRKHLSESGGQSLWEDI